MAAQAPFDAAAAAHACGASVELIDVERATGTLDVGQLEQRLASGAPPHVVVASHADGVPSDLERLLALRRRFDFQLLEDASESLGARVRVERRWFRAGEHPEVHATVFAFEPGAAVASERAGAVATHHAALAARLTTLAGPADGAARELGLDCALGDLAAALGARRLASLPERLAARRELASRYFGALPGFGLPAVAGSKEPAWRRFAITCERGERDAVRVHLQERRLAVALPRRPLSLEPWLQARSTIEPCPVAETRARTQLVLPIHAQLSHAEQGRLIAALAEWTRARRAA
jgi:dTDP-4-amino-4,6-dideoxygalactose transaminase